MIFYGANVFTKEGMLIQKYVDKRLIDKLEDEDEVIDVDDKERKEQE